MKLRTSEMNVLKNMVYIGGLVTLGLLMGCSALKFNKAVPQKVFSDAQLVLTLPWNGAVIKAEEPASIPQSILTSRAYKKWEHIGNKTDFVGLDADGNRVVVAAAGFGKDSKGQRLPIYESMKVYSPKNVLMQEVIYWVGGDPLAWTNYDLNGQFRKKVGTGYSIEKEKSHLNSRS